VVTTAAGITGPSRAGRETRKRLNR
jgi:transposase, IS6 family